VIEPLNNDRGLDSALTAFFFNTDLQNTR